MKYAKMSYLWLRNCCYRYGIYNLITLFLSLA